MVTPNLTKVSKIFLFRPADEINVSFFAEDKKAALAITELGAGLEVLYSLYTTMCNVVLLVYDSTQCSSLSQAVALLEMLEAHVNPGKLPVSIFSFKCLGTLQRYKN